MILMQYGGKSIHESFKVLPFEIGWESAKIQEIE